MELKTIELTKKFGSKTAVNHLNITLTCLLYTSTGHGAGGRFHAGNILQGAAEPIQRQPGKQLYLAGICITG